jgi:hypothetical protein
MLQLHDVKTIGDRPNPVRHGVSISSASGIGGPEDFVLLQAEADVDIRFENPLSQVGGIDLPPHRREVHAVGLLGEIVFARRGQRVFEIGSAADHELHLVGSREVFQILAAQRVGLSAVGAFHVDDFPHARIDTPHLAAAIRFQERLIARVAQCFQQHQRPRLKERFAAGDFHSAAVESLDGLDDFLDAHGVSVVGGAGVGRIAPGAVEVTPGQSDEHTRQAHSRGLALEADEDFVDD